MRKTMDSKGKMAGGMGVSPRKAMAMSGDSSGFGVMSYPGCKGVQSPDMGMGRRGEMADGQRGIGMAVGGGKGMHGSQASPDHGSYRDHFNRDGKA